MLTVFSPCLLYSEFLQYYSQGCCFAVFCQTLIRLLLFINTEIPGMLRTHWYLKWSFFVGYAWITLNRSMFVACSWLNNWDTVDFIWNCLSRKRWLEIHTQEAGLRLYQWYCTEQLFHVFIFASEHDLNQNIAQLFITFLNSLKCYFLHYCCSVHSEQT